MLAFIALLEYLTPPNIIIINCEHFTINENYFYSERVLQFSFTNNISTTAHIKKSDFVFATFRMEFLFDHIFHIHIHI